jgi:plastocyanin
MSNKTFIIVICLIAIGFLFGLVAGLRIQKAAEQPKKETSADHSSEAISFVSGSSASGEAIRADYDPYFTLPEHSAATAAQVEITRGGISPKELHVRQGDKVVLTVEDAASTYCQFLHHEEREGLISVIGMAPSSPPGSWSAFFAAPPPGTYTFFCDIPGHDQFGIHGTMIVEQDATL